MMFLRKLLVEAGCLSLSVTVRLAGRFLITQYQSDLATQAISISYKKTVIATKSGPFRAANGAHSTPRRPGGGRSAKTGA
jgi:hypothetical protein